MAGVRQFDEDAVLDGMVEIFWERGYQATSIDDLVAATSLKRGSLYNAFGGKERLFLAVLDRYNERITARLTAPLDDPDPRRAIVRLFEESVARLIGRDRPRGCLTINTCFEFAEAGEAVSRKVGAQLADLETAIYRTLLRAQAQEQLAPGRDLRALARFFMATNRSLALLHKAQVEPSVLRDVAKVALTVWDAPGADAERTCAGVPDMCAAADDACQLDASRTSGPRSPSRRLRRPKERQR